MKRVLLKLSGEALSASSGQMYDTGFVDRVAEQIASLVKEGYEIALVIGAGNIFRGRSSDSKMDRTTADQMGMLATVLNSLCMKDALIRAGVRVAVMSAVAMPPFAEGYSAEGARELLSSGTVVICGAGLGIPYISTDTAGAVRAAEIKADAMFMAKNIDYIYTEDPKKNPLAPKLERVSCSYILEHHLGAIDLTAAAFCLSTKMPVQIFGMFKPEDIGAAVRGERVGTLVIPE